MSIGCFEGLIKILHQNYFLNKIVFKDIFVVNLSKEELKWVEW